MTSISSVSSTNSLYSNSTSSTSKPKSAVDVAASLFGMSSSDLRSELKSGKSLDDVAKEKGVSTDDLDQALVKNMPAGLAATGDPAAIAKKIASQVGDVQGSQGTSGPQGPPPPPPSDGTSSTSSSGTTSVLDTLSSLLGTDSDTLKSELTSGTSLSDLLQKSGVSMDSLASTLQQGLLVDTTA